MKTIKSFTVNHDKLTKGIYISRIDGDAVTYDLRMKTPNQGSYLDNPALHTLEHLMATYIRNSKFSHSVIYTGPMGCRTGFYLIVRDAVSSKDVISLVQDTMKFISEFSGAIPGSERVQCGNYLNHDLLGAINEAREYLKVISSIDAENLNYPE